MSVLVSPHMFLNRPLNLLYSIECPADKNNDDSKDIFDELGDNSVAKKSISKDMREETGAPASCVSNEGLDQESEEIENATVETSTTRRRPRRKTTVIVAARMKIKNCSMRIFCLVECRDNEDHVRVCM